MCNKKLKKNCISQPAVDRAKAVLRGKSVAVNAYAETGLKSETWL